jgi:hypothetical protein
MPMTVKVMGKQALDSTLPPVSLHWFHHENTISTVFPAAIASLPARGVYDVSDLMTNAACKLMAAPVGW